MDVFEVPIEVVRLAEAIVFASPEPVTWQRLGPLLPCDLDPGAVLETLVLIALHQPVTRAEIEGIRGVALAQTTMDLMLESGLVQPWGRKEAPGRPTLWVTTPRFLTQFGLRSLRDLPGSHLTRSNAPSQASAAEPLVSPPDQPGVPGSDRPL